ncbi:MAG TPA: hypothetical protein VNR59_11230 [Gaiellaceae bacterium]|nr:hypothetical protein [Gaiellaceae bacterium]
MQSQSNRRSNTSWLNPARGALLFAAKRLLGLAAVLLVISFGTFSLLRFAFTPSRMVFSRGQTDPRVNALSEAIYACL